VTPLDPEYDDLIKELELYFASHGTTINVQLIKLQEEMGEVAEAFIGFMGFNPRKGITHNTLDVALELADVVITALVAIRLAGYEPQAILAMQAEQGKEATQ
jgi:NTP pyrophosphatase (non-canonical NTP hydrolase)